MAIAVWILAGLVWLALWIGIIAARAAKTEGDALVALFSSTLPAFSAATCLAAFAAVPAREPAFHRIVLGAHIASISALFLFLVAAEYLQAEAWFRIRRRFSILSVAASYRRLWVITKIAPAPIALMVFLTGLRLIWDSPQPNSPVNLWLVGLIIGFGLFFWDGILGYQPIVRRMWEYWKQLRDAGTVIADAAPMPCYLRDTLQLTLHFLSWPIVFLLGFFRWSAVTPLTAPISNLIYRLASLSTGWPEVIAAIILWLLAGAVVGLGRILLRSLTRSGTSQDKAPN
jgi:hypothetical protein